LEPLSLPEGKTCETCRFWLFRQDVPLSLSGFCIMQRKHMSKQTDACELYTEKSTTHSLCVHVAKDVRRNVPKTVTGDSTGFSQDTLT